MPATKVIVYGVMHLLGEPLPAPEIPILMGPPLLLVFFMGGLAEELGWTGYVLDPLQERSGALQASLLVGVVGATWHLVPLLQVGRSPPWIAWWCLSTVSVRVLYTWLYNNTGKSVFGAASLHAVSNLSWQLFPNRGSHDDPRIDAIILAIAAIRHQRLGTAKSGSMHKGLTRMHPNQFEGPPTKRGYHAFLRPRY